MKAFDKTRLTDYNFFDIDNISEESLKKSEILFYVLAILLAISLLNVFITTCTCCITSRLRVELEITQHWISLIRLIGFGLIIFINMRLKKELGDDPKIATRFCDWSNLSLVIGASFELIRLMCAAIVHR